MDRIDARKLNAAQRATLRRVAVRMHRRGWGKAEIAAELGVHPWTVGGWIRAFEARGEVALQEARRGRTPGSGRVLTPAQEARLQQDMTTPPRRAGSALCAVECSGGARLDRPALSRASAGAHRAQVPPLKYAYERDPQAVERWLEVDYPRIVARAQREGAEIHWGDETAVSSHEQFPRGYAPRGQTP